ncbi:MAG: cytidine deaminase [Candidatus Amulumruptor caecigallinarius]|nr:cytidine deaminase [Candidatus Amulumruptor caecigallinarius]
MKDKTISVTVSECKYEELSHDDRELVDLAREMTRTSMAPYSKFHVGAAIRMANGEIVRGSNQENAAFSSGTCAERTACFQASALYPGVAMKQIAIAAWTREGHDDEAAWEECFQAEPISPCGSCRQSLLEYENAYGRIEVILYGKNRIIIFPSVASLLPFCFTKF